MKALRFAGLWVLPSLLGAMFVLIGLGKFGAPGWEADFARWGYPPAAHQVVGVVEMLAGLALMAPRLTSWAGGVIVVVMLGAVATHVYWNEPSQLARPLVFLALAALAAYLRRDNRIGARVPAPASEPTA